MRRYFACVFATTATAIINYFALTPHAQADTYAITHTGTECEQEYTTNPKIYRSLSTVYNDDSSSRTFSCAADPSPLIVLGSEAHYQSHGWWVAYVIDNHPTQNISCYLRLCELDGAHCSSSETRTTTGTGVQPLRIYPSEFQSNYGQTADLRCSVPAKTSDGRRSGIRSYMIWMYN